MNEISMGLLLVFGVSGPECGRSKHQELELDLSKPNFEIAEMATPNSTHLPAVKDQSQSLFP